MEFTLSEILWIEKCEFHEVIIDIITKKNKQSTNNIMTSNLQGKRGVGDEGEKNGNEYICKNISCMKFIEEKSEIQASSHFSLNTNSKGSLHGTCSSIRLMIEDINDEQSFFAQDSSTYPIIVWQPHYI